MGHFWFTGFARINYTYNDLFLIFFTSFMFIGFIMFFYILFLDEPDSNLNGKLAFNILKKICANLKVTIFMTIHNTECIHNLDFDYEITFHSLDKGSFSVHKIIP
jgi:predicted ATP-dependent endonuclease of OLD family